MPNQFSGIRHWIARHLSRPLDAVCEQLDENVDDGDAPNTRPVPPAS
jgi:hypothetical protein